jgi:hypothetical protein
LGKKIKGELKGFQAGEKQGVETAFERVQVHVAVDLVRVLRLA